jgi:hypothetical protein
VTLSLLPVETCEVLLTTDEMSRKRKEPQSVIKADLTWRCMALS